MGNNTLQSLESIRPLGQQDGPAAGGQAGELTPAQQDYKDGRNALKQGEQAQAAMCFHNALKGFEADNDQIGIANAADRLGDICLAREEYEQALRHFRRAYVICEKEEDPFSLVSLNKKIAVAYKKLGRLDDALKTLFLLFDHYAEVHNPQGSVQILEVIAEVYIQQGTREKAADVYQTIASIHRNFSHKRDAAAFADKAEQVLK